MNAKIRPHGQENRVAVMLLRTAVAVTAVLASLIVVSRAQAQSLPDPTRPPAESFVPRTAVLGDASEPNEARSRAVRQPPTLQGVLIAPGRRHAVLEGRVVLLGETLQGFQLVAIRADGVTLEAPGRKVDVTLMELPQKTGPGRARADVQPGTRAMREKR
jgi:hypothetical protein